MEPFEALEVELAEWLGCEPEKVVVCASGTAALHLALEATMLAPDSRILIPDYTMIACARAATLAGLIPVFGECTEDLLLHPKVVLNTKRSVQAIMAVHVYGRRTQMEVIHRVAVEHGQVVIEDMAEAHGVDPHPRTDAACYSFYRNKIVAGEEGGAIKFANPTNARLARMLRSLGATPVNDYSHLARGHNYRMSNLHAEPIRRSLQNVDSLLLKRRQIEQWYNACCPAVWKMPSRDVPWVYDLRIPNLTTQTQMDLVDGLKAQGIAARHGFKLMHSQLEYGSHELLTVAGEPSLWWKRSQALADEVIYLPIQVSMTKEMVEKVMDEVIRLVGR